MFTPYGDTLGSMGPDSNEMHKPGLKKSLTKYCGLVVYGNNRYKQIHLKNAKKKRKTIAIRNK